MEGLNKKEKELMDMDNSVVMVGEGRKVEVKEGIERLNGDGKIKHKMN